MSSRITKVLVVMFVYFNQKPADAWRISDWSSDVCSSDLALRPHARAKTQPDFVEPTLPVGRDRDHPRRDAPVRLGEGAAYRPCRLRLRGQRLHVGKAHRAEQYLGRAEIGGGMRAHAGAVLGQIGIASCRERVCQEG